MINHYLDDLLNTSRRILLLQGPIGDFFFEFGKWLKNNQKEVYKINFNGGDAFYYPNSTSNTFNYQDNFIYLKQYLIDFCLKYQIDSIICFGDNRPCHKIAKHISKELNIHFWVFEEGYFRPHYITFEKDGVNAYSPLPKQADFYLRLSSSIEGDIVPKTVAKGFLPIAKRAIRYYWETHKFAEQYPHYRHHRHLSLFHYGKLWSGSLLRRMCYWLHERSFSQRVNSGAFGRFFIVPLQVYNDSQISEHTDFSSVEAFLRKVLDSFAHDAPNYLNLIVKHHPMDRGFIDYQTVISEYCIKYPHLDGRIFYIHDVPLPVLLRKGIGMITLNSTSGLSALLHNMPVKTLGRANYDFEGMTDQKDLADFWHNPTPPDHAVFNAYRKFHLNKTQINGSFYNEVLLP